MPLLVNVFGVELDKRGTPLFSGQSRPQRAIWHRGEIVRLFADVLERRLVDTDASLPLPLEARVSVRLRRWARFSPTRLISIKSGVGFRRSH